MKNKVLLTVLALSVVGTGLASDKQAKKQKISSESTSSIASASTSASTSSTSSASTSATTPATTSSSSFSTAPATASSSSSSTAPATASVSAVASVSVTKTSHQMPSLQSTVEPLKEGEIPLSNKNPQSNQTIKLPGEVTEKELIEIKETFHQIFPG